MLFRSRRQGRCRLRRIVVDDRLEFGLVVVVADEERIDQEKELRLALVEVAHELQEEREVVLLPADHGRGRMFARGGEERAVGRALNLDEPFGAAARRTDLLAESRTCAPRFSLAAKRAHHSRIIV